MREGIISEVRAEYEILRANNHAEEERRRAEAMAKGPEIARLFAQRQSSFQKAMRSALSHEMPAERIEESLARAIDGINRKLRACLAASGFPEDYLQPIYQCPHCNDTGVIGDTLQERCECFTARLRAHLYADASHGLDASETFQRFNEAVYPNTPLPDNPADTQRAYMARMRDRCLAYAEGYPSLPQRNLLLMGKSGLGKTYLMNCIGNRLLERGYEVRKITAYQLSERMRASIFEHDPSAFTALLSLPMLMLDDLGAEPLYNNITVESLFTLLNERELRGLHTVVSTNLTALELKQAYTERVTSRLFAKKSTAMLPFIGTDVRLRTP